VGLAFYTLGQRKGIGLGGAREGSGEPWFVARKDMASNTLWVVQGHDHPWLQSRRIAAIDASWVSGSGPAPGTRLSAKTRYRQADAACTVAAAADGAFALAFDEAQWAATPGQSAVLYDGEVCLGGGIIESVQGPG
jgi:tRNA-specific 2-thiouridylase